MSKSACYPDGKDSFIMKHTNSFILAFREYYQALTIKGTKPGIFYTEKRGFEVSWYFKKSTIVDKLKAEVIYG